MVKFKVLKRFRDKHTKDVYEANEEIEMTVKRADEVKKNLDGSFLERIEDEEEKVEKEVIAEKKEKDEKKKVEGAK